MPDGSDTTPDLLDINFPSDGHWVCVEVRRNKERQVAALLEQKGYTFFLPTYPTLQRSSDRIHKAEVPLFPGYIFCQCDPHQSLPVLGTPNVIRIHKEPDQHALLEDLHGIRQIMGLASSLNDAPGLVHQQIAEVQAKFDAELIKYLAKHPRKLYEIDPRKFEELVAELLRDMGYQVRLTPLTKDGGRDILAIISIPAGEVLVVVECKRFGPNRPIGPDIVQRLMWVADRYDNASRAMLATTSFFTAGAKRLATDFRWRLGLKDFDDVCDWLDQYGSWERNSKAGLWVPNGRNRETSGD
jgi:restriction endonuclease Mrr